MWDHAPRQAGLFELIGFSELALELMSEACARRAALARVSEADVRAIASAMGGGGVAGGGGGGTRRGGGGYVSPPPPAGGHLASVANAAALSATGGSFSIATASERAASKQQGKKLRKVRFDCGFRFSVQPASRTRDRLAPGGANSLHRWFACGGREAKL